ncbi:MAG: hypothetical protein RMJ59_02115 [Candidatus Nitrosocaldus sp.]|nr:hypothetical protein [Candidatus Nitrosocaldus sp.]MDW8275162.1 hypothetical protein [Candidatus Nitrosocaldus sp.]
MGIRFTSIDGNPFFEAYMYIQANTSEFDARISALEYNSKRAREFERRKKAAAWAIRIRSMASNGDSNNDNSTSSSGRSSSSSSSSSRGSMSRRENCRWRVYAGR